MIIKNALKKRFKMTGTGKILAKQSGKRHRMARKSNKFLRNSRGITALSESENKRIINILGGTKL